MAPRKNDEIIKDEKDAIEVIAENYVTDKTIIPHFTLNSYSNNSYELTLLKDVSVVIEITFMGRLYKNLALLVFISNHHTF